MGVKAAMQGIRHTEPLKRHQQARGNAQGTLGDAKGAVKDYWENNVCETREAQAPKYSKEYFAQIEAYRYAVTPGVFEFAQFTRWHNKSVLEIGVGAGTDFAQWVIAGANAYGVDLTEAAVEHTRQHIRDLCPEPWVQRMDCEALEYQNEKFDLVYSWGVLHHTPDTEKAIGEAVRVCKKGGRIKLMLYNRHSVQVWFLWGYANFVRGHFPKGIKRCLDEEMESAGTKAFTEKELKRMFAKLPVRIVQMEAKVNNYDLLWRHPKPLQWIAYTLCSLFVWNRCGFFRTIELEKVNQ